MHILIVRICISTYLLFFYVNYLSNIQKHQYKIYILTPKFTLIKKHSKTYRYCT